MKKRLVLLFLLPCLVFMLIYTVPRIKLYRLLHSERIFEDLNDLEMFFWKYNYIFSGFPTLDIEKYENFVKEEGYSAWPNYWDKLLNSNLHYLIEDSNSRYLCIEFEPKIFENQQFDTLINMNLFEFVFSQKKILVDYFEFYPLIYPNRYSEVFFVKKGFEVPVNQQMRQSLKRDLGIYADYIIFKYDLKKDIPNFIRYDINNSASDRFKVVLGENEYFDQNEMFFEDLTKILKIYKDKLSSYDEIYFDLGLYPSRIYKLPDSSINVRKDIAFEHMLMLINLSNE